MQEIDEIARRQWGLISHDQLTGFVSRQQLATMRKHNRIITVHRGLYRMAGVPITWQQRVAAALFVLPDGVASYFTAARLHGLRVDVAQPIHITLPVDRATIRSGVEIHRCGIAEHHVVVVQRVSCTSLERTIVDLAGVLSKYQLAFVIDEAVVAGKTSFAKISAVARECGGQGRKGSATLKALLDDRLPLADGFDRAIELKVLKAAKKAKLSQPQTQFAVGPYFIDAAWPELKIGAEADGYNVHTASRIRHTKDRRRRNELETLGWKILNFTHDMSVSEIADVLLDNVKV